MSPQQHSDGLVALRIECVAWSSQGIVAIARQHRDDCGLRGYSVALYNPMKGPTAPPLATCPLGGSVCALAWSQCADALFVCGPARCCIVARRPPSADPSGSDDAWSVHEVGGESPAVVYVEWFQANSHLDRIIATDDSPPTDDAWLTIDHRAVLSLWKPAASRKTAPVVSHALLPGASHTDCVVRATAQFHTDNSLWIALVSRSGLLTVVAVETRSQSGGAVPSTLASEPLLVTQVDGAPTKNSFDIAFVCDALLLATWTPTAVDHSTFSCTLTRFAPSAASEKWTRRCTESLCVSAPHWAHSRTRIALPSHSHFALINPITLTRDTTTSDSTSTGAGGPSSSSAMHCTMSPHSCMILTSTLDTPIHTIPLPPPPPPSPITSDSDTATHYAGLLAPLLRSPSAWWDLTVSLSTTPHSAHIAHSLPSFLTTTPYAAHAPALHCATHTLAHTPSPSTTALNTLLLTRLLHIHSLFPASHPPSPSVLSLTPILRPLLSSLPSVSLAHSLSLWHHSEWTVSLTVFFVKSLRALLTHNPVSLPLIEFACDMRFVQCLRSLLVSVALFRRVCIDKTYANQKHNEPRFMVLFAELHCLFPIVSRIALLHSQHTETAPMIPMETLVNGITEIVPLDSLSFFDAPQFSLETLQTQLTADL